MTTTSCPKPVTSTSLRLDRTASATSLRTPSDRPVKGPAVRRFLTVLMRSLSAWAV